MNIAMHIVAATVGITSSAALAQAAGTPTPPPAQAAKPNIIFIMADDLGIDTLSCYGSDTYRTPNIDKLAASGMKFDWAYCTPVCGPTRAQLMTGQYPFRNGCLDIDATTSACKPTTSPSIASMMKSAGYVTGMAGKWKQLKLDPIDWGFDDRLVSPSANGYYWNTAWSLNGKEVKVDKEVYFPDVMSAYALQFVREHKDQPFFFYYALTNPHVPIVRTPDSATNETDGHKLYSDNIAYIDKLVGELVDEVEKQGLRERTIIFFTGDNGSGSNPSKVKGRRLDGSKAQVRNGGAHVPLIANCPGIIPQGRVCTDLVDFSDMLPTFAQLGGASLPKDKVIDGRSFAPQLQGRPGDPRKWVFVQLGQEYFARSARYMLNQDGVLFDMSDEPFAARKVENLDDAARNGRDELQKVLDDLNPRAGATWSRWTGWGNRGPGKSKTTNAAHQ